MKPVRVLVLLLVLISFLFVIQISKDKLIIDNITSKGVLDAKAILIALGVAVNVDATVPIIYIDSPLNQTYTITSLELNFTIVENNLDKTYYNLDDGSNTTITGNTSFTTTVGSHTLKLFANDTLGNLNSSSVTFAVTQADSGGGGGSAGGGGGGGGKAVTEIITGTVDFSLSTDLIKISLLQGESEVEFVEITNNDIKTLQLTIDLVNIKDLIIFPGGVSSYELTLNPGETKTIQILFNIPKDYPAGIYIGRISVNSGQTTKSITTIVEVETSKKIFDVDLKLDSNKVVRGNDLIVQLVLFNLGLDQGRVDANVEIGLKDLEGNTITKEDLIAAVETQASLIEGIFIPKYLEEGIYVVYATVNYGGEVGTASEVIEVTSSPEGFLRLSTFYYYIIPIAIFIIIIILLEHYRHHHKIKILTKIKHENILTAIRRARRKGFSNEQIIIQLKRKGWKDDQIKEIFKRI